MAKRYVHSKKSSFNVYWIGCDVTDLGYVGITGWSIEDRFAKHLQNAKHQRKGQLYKAMRAFGGEHFSISFLQAASSWDEVCEIECRLIKELGTKHPAGYNMTDGGDGNHGYEYTDEVRARMSASGKLKRLSAEHRAKIGAAHKGRKLPQEQIEKLRASKKGKKFSPELRAKLSRLRAGRAPTAMIQSNIGRKHSEETKAKMSASMTGLTRSEESRRNMAAAARIRSDKLLSEGRHPTPPSWAGKKHSPETLAKMRAAWERRRQAKAVNDTPPETVYSAVSPDQDAR